MEEQRDEGGGRILLGNNTGDGAVTLRPIRFQCGGVWISTGLTCTRTRARAHTHTHIYIYIFENTQYPITIYAKFRFAPDIPGRKSGLSRGVFIFSVKQI
jgi:hypothetical protein